MAHHNQIEFLQKNRDLLREPILLVGAKVYDYDQFDLKAELSQMGFREVIGTDLEAGKGVDDVLDITNPHAPQLAQWANRFATVICMEVLTNVNHPFRAAEHVNRLLKPGGTVVLSECFVRKISKMPVDYWRFTYDGLKALFPEFTFEDDRSRFSITRQRQVTLRPFVGRFAEVVADHRHADESAVGFLVRRIHRKWLSRGIFKISRWLPEQTIYAIGIKPAH
ncbi:MAG: methyltransferase domain-containing protein [Cyclobacteriaceae bacterium]|nr:methyltransferase domain-containing protein [Cyclobacteriaceae bacterium]